MQRKCSCGNLFVPRVERQMRCMRCILEKEPPLPPEDDTDPRHGAFSEWFIYHWHHIRKSACEAKGIRFVYDDGIIGKEIEVQKKPSIAKLARKYGLKPELVRKRLRTGWTLNEALGKVERKKVKNNG